MSLVIGVIGHVDHGKTALVRALTGEETDRLPEEKSRGISIALGFARLEGEAQNIDLIDMPGHERFVRTMIAGATGIAAVLLVLAANEGVKPQTIEHLDIASLLGLRQAILAISKADLVTPEEAEAAAATGQKLLAASGFSTAATILTSALTGQGMEALRAALFALPPPGAQAQGFPVLPIDRAFAVPGFGPVVTGTLRGAAIAAGDALELFPEQKILRVRGVQSHGASLATAAPGQRVALNLRDVEIGALSRGMLLAAPGLLTPSAWLTILLRATASAPKLKNGMMLRALLGTMERDARLRLLAGDTLEPGETGLAQLHFATPIAIPARLHAILRTVSPARTVAGGMVLDPVTKRLRRRDEAVLARLGWLAQAEPEAIPLAEIEAQGAAGTSLPRLSQLSALASAQISRLLAGQPVHAGRAGLLVAQAALDSLTTSILDVLAPLPDGLPPAQLLSALPETSAAVLDEAIALLLARNLLARRGAKIILKRPEQDRARAAGEAALATQIAMLLREAGLAPPDPKTIITGLAEKRAVDRLLREGVIIRAVDRAKNKEILFHRQAIKAAIAQLAPLLEASSGLLATEIGAALGISRKYTIPLLDHLDAIRFTRRVGDHRLRGAATLSSILSNV